MRDTARHIWTAGLEAADAGQLVKDSIQLTRKSLIVSESVFSLHDFDRVVVVGAGKSAGAMAAAFEDLMLTTRRNEADQPARPAIIGRVHVVDDDPITLRELTRVAARPRLVNLPTERTVVETNTTIELLQSCNVRDLVLFFITGGASALLEAPAPLVQLHELQEIVQQLFQAGTPIEEVNAFRGRLSRVKHGGLLNFCRDSQSISLVLSDVLSGGIEVVGSGPTIAAANSQAIDVAAIVRERVPDFDLPAAVRSCLETSSPKNVAKGSGNSLHDESSSASHPSSESGRHQAVLIGDSETAVQGSVKAALGLGCSSVSIDSEVDRRNVFVDELADEYCRRLIGMREQAVLSGERLCFISGGEPVVQVDRVAGIGGRNSHLALLFLSQLEQHQERYSPKGSAFFFCSVATDGEDGSGDCAGAFIDNEVWWRFKNRETVESLNCALRNFESFSFLQRLDALIPSFPARTNVCDLRLLLVDP